MNKYEKMFPNYNDCLTNLSASILKRFNIEDNHNTLKDIDDILNKYKKIIVILYDGLGSYILNKHLDENSFLQKHKYRDFYSVFPPTTACATTSFLTCKNANETGWCGWHMYFKDIDKDLIMFNNVGYYDEEITEKDYTYLNYNHKNIVTKINEKGFNTKEVYSFRGYENLSSFLNEINNFMNLDKEGFMYAYYTEPDSLLHQFGTYSNEVNSIIKNIDEKMDKLCHNIDDETLIIVTADHGHIDVEYLNLFLDNEIKNNLIVNPYCDSRTVMFKVKDKEKFKKHFKHNYGGIFDLYSKEEIIQNKLFGDKENNELFLKNLGDFIAVAKSNYYIDYSKTNEQYFKSHHSGITRQEMMIPLILIHR